MSHRAAGWLAWSLLALALLFGVLGCLLLVLNGGRSSSFSTWYTLAFLTFPVVGVVIASRRPENPIGWMFCVIGLANTLYFFADGYGIYALLTRPGVLPGGAWVVWSQYWTALIMWALMFFSLLLFPTGKLPSPRWRPVAWVLAGFFALATVLFVIKPGPFEGTIVRTPNPTGIEPAAGIAEVGLNTVIPIFSIVVLAAPASVLVRFRRSRGEERQQLKWLAYTGGLWVVVDGISQLTRYVLPDRMVDPADNALYLVAVAPIPVAVGIAILRYRLYDIDFLINRTLVYGALSACVVGTYVLVVGYLGATFRVDGSLAISLVATGIVAVLFAPVRERLQRGVNRLMYGERDEPYAVLSRLGQRLEATLDPKSVLPTIVETVAGALKSPHAEVSLYRDGGFETAARHGTPAGDPLVLPLAYGNETVGRLAVAPRAKGEPFTATDRRLLEDLARQAGVAAHAVRLTEDLQRSRERLVSAREEERRRLRRDLHDGVGPRLAALTLRIETARNGLAHDPDSQDLLSDLAERAREAVADVRRSVHALRPPVLDDLGLVPALRETAAQYSGNGPEITLQAPDTLPSLPAAVEVAAYRIAQEAITNVVRHAGANNCAVRLATDGDVLHLEIEDDGRGIGPDGGPGVGLSSMRERAEELGGACAVGAGAVGGTRVRAELPVGERSEDDG